MTGMELFEALSFVDERYIAQAETATLNRNAPWMKVLSVAACLCILIVGAFAYGEINHKDAMESITEYEAAAAPEAALEEAAPEEGAPKEETAAGETAAGVPESAQIPAGELQQISSATLRIINLTDGGFEAMVEEVSADTNLFEVGMQVTVIIDPDRVPGNRLDADSTAAEEAKLAEDLLVAVENGAYDAGTGTLYVDGIRLTE